MSSHSTAGRYILAYHHGGDIVGTASGSGELADRQRYADKLNADDHAGGRWAVHELGPEVAAP
jgi:hypothetical protein